MAADKYFGYDSTNGKQKLVSGTVTSAGAENAGDIVALTDAGILDLTLMPTGIGPDVKEITASEALTAGDFVNFHVSSGLKVRKAINTSADTRAMGFVKANVNQAAAATVYTTGYNDAVTGLTAGSLYFIGGSAGLATATVPTTAFNQEVGVALTTGCIDFKPTAGFTL